MQKMSSLTFPDGSSYEITDDKARKDITEINNDIDNVQGAIDELNTNVEDVQTKLKHHDYLDIKDKITLSENCEFVNYAIVKNSFVHIRVKIKANVSGYVTLFNVNDEYKPIVEVNGNMTYTVGGDANKVVNAAMGSNGKGEIWTGSNTLNNGSYFQVSYPI